MFFWFMGCKQLENNKRGKVAGFEGALMDKTSKQKKNRRRRKKEGKRRKKKKERKRRIWRIR